LVLLLEELEVRAVVVLALHFALHTESTRRRGRGRRTSAAVVVRAPQSSRGSKLMSSFGFNSMSSATSSASLGWRGKEVDVLLQALTAQVRKLSVRTFIVSVVSFNNYRI
jgi:hypothetical protein